MKHIIKFIKKIKETVGMYDFMISQMIVGQISTDERVESNKIHIGYSSIESKNRVKAYFIITRVPEEISVALCADIRNLRGGEASIDFCIKMKAYSIDWESADMKNKLKVWEGFKNRTSNSSVWDRKSQAEQEKGIRLMESVDYLNKAEKRNRQLVRVNIVISVSADRGTTFVEETVENFKTYSKLYGVGIERVDCIVDKMPIISTMCRRKSGRMGKGELRVTDEIASKLTGIYQGTIGDHGIPLGVDVYSKEVVLRKFKDGGEVSDNWLIAATTGGGKSFFVKSLLMYLLASGLTLCIMDYEGDEYNGLANYIRAGNREDSLIIHMGDKDEYYVDPMPIPKLYNVESVDKTLKEYAIRNTLAYFNVMMGGASITQRKIISTAIGRVYASFKVTDNRETWGNSKKARIGNVYEELVAMDTRREMVNADEFNRKNVELQAIIDAISVYFEPGESKYGSFSNSISLEEVNKAKIVVFSFGTKGANKSILDSTVIQLKQLSVAFLSNQISNHSKYVKKTCNVKVWEEIRRWSDIEGAESIIVDAAAGGRKRGDINLFITNNVEDLIDVSNGIASTLIQNVENVALGRIKGEGIRAELLKQLGREYMSEELKHIAKDKGGMYQNSFCIDTVEGIRCVAKAQVHGTVAKSNIMKSTGLK